MLQAPSVSDENSNVDVEAVVSAPASGQQSPAKVDTQDKKKMVRFNSSNVTEIHPEESNKNFNYGLICRSRVFQYYNCMKNAIVWATRKQSS